MQPGGWQPCTACPAGEHRVVTLPPSQAVPALPVHTLQHVQAVGQGWQRAVLLLWCAACCALPNRLPNA